MKQLLLLASLPAIALGFSKTQEAGPLTNQWVCGQALVSGDNKWLARTPTAGILLIDSISGLDYYRTDPKETRWGSSEDIARWDSMPYSKLFCSSYLSQYKTPSLSSRIGGVCVRNITEGGKWNAVLEADNEVRQLHAHFATQHGFARSSPRQKDADPNSGSLLWGSGATGSNPANWCDAYVKQMLCHIAFPQFAGNEADLTGAAGSFTALNGGAPVRPVCGDACDTIMDNCNRKEPNPRSQTLTALLEAGARATINPGDFDASDDGKEELSNGYYCASWNRGIGLARVCDYCFL